MQQWVWEREREIATAIIIKWMYDSQITVAYVQTLYIQCMRIFWHNSAVSANYTLNSDKRHSI
jgi:hypothetical protein